MTVRLGVFRHSWLRHRYHCRYPLGLRQVYRYRVPELRGRLEVHQRQTPSC